MRKILVLTLILCLLTPAVAVRAEADFYTELLGTLNALEALRAEAAVECSGAREELAVFALAYGEALESMGTYDLQSFRDQLAQRGQRMDAVAEGLSAIRGELASRQGADAAQRSALLACTDYADGALSAVNAFRRTNAFLQAQYVASEPLDALSAESASGDFSQTQFATARKWETGSEQVVANMSALTPPDYLSQVWQIYLRQVRLFATMCRLCREGIGYGDVLRLYSSSQLLSLQYSSLAKYEMQMYDLHFRLYTQVEDRLAGLAEDIGPELISACQAPGTDPFEYRGRRPSLKLSYELTDFVYPNLYHNMDAAVILTACTDRGSRNLLVMAEIVGFSQPIQQRLTVTEELTHLTFKPPVLPDLPKLNSARETQLAFSITDADTGELLAQESHPLKLYSRYDFELYDNEFGTVRYYDILAWMSPESEGVLKVRREAISWMDAHGSGLTSLVGYQNSLGMDEGYEFMNTREQAIALQGAISDLGVRYNMGAFSLNAFQRILTPDAVVESRSGVCVETAVLLASALQSSEMHPMILFIPGHSQVALEVWRDTPEYFLLETTLLPFEGTDDEKSAFCRYLTQEEWLDYLEDCASRGVAYVVDCELVNVFDYQGIE